MQIQDVTFRNERYSVYDVYVGELLVGTYSYASKGKYNLNLKFPGIRDNFLVRDQYHAADIVKRAATTVVTKLTVN